jgi:hypothetical protein
VRVRDIVTDNPNARFRNDVQLSSFRSSDNFDLVKSFIFTRKAAQGKRSSLDILQTICDAFLPARNPNRFTVVATYGQGKSHFGLAVANFFGKDINSREASALLDGIAHAAADDAAAAQFRASKENRGPFLVVTLRGDEPADLQAKFFRGLEVALKDHPSTQDVQPPFWFTEAENFLAGLSGKVRERADLYLEDRGTDLLSVIAGVKRREPGMHDVCRQLAHHLFGMLPDFGGLTSLCEAVEWVADAVCTNGGPPGMIILFDEFSAFVRDYGLGAKGRPGTPLQDLLNGVENRRSKVVFVALSQHDPDAVARSALKEDPENMNSILRELNRLPHTQRYILHTELEAVVDSYLKQDRASWAAVMNEEGFRKPLFAATDSALVAFHKRYQKDLGWTAEDFQSTVSEGCYPLHPMTTALLSSIEFQSTVTPRSVLAFLDLSLRSILDEPALDGHRPRWIWPISLAEYFGEMLGEEHWAAYREALVQAGGPDAPDRVRDVLRGVLLQVAGGVSTKSLGYAKVLSHFCGYPSEQVQSDLDELSRLVIRRDVQGYYTFWPAGRGAGKVGDMLQRKRLKMERNWSLVEAINDFLEAEVLVVSQPVSLPWGHPTDWCAKQLIVFARLITAEVVQTLVNRWTSWAPDCPELPRGVILWALAESEEEVSHLRETGASILDKALGDDARPVVLCVPRGQQRELADALFEMQGVWSMTTQEIQDTGKDQFAAIKNDRRDQLKRALRVMQEPWDCFVPKACRAGVAAVHPVGPEATTAEVFRLCYTLGIRDFFPNKAQSSPFRKAVALVCNLLITDSVRDNLDALRKNAVAHEVFRALSASKWGLVGGDSGGVKVPGLTARSHAGWQVLEKALPVGAGTVLADPLKTLLNPPYGYDFNTLSLLVAGWFGVHRFDTDLTIGGSSTPLDRAMRDSDDSLKSPKQFISELSKGKVLRREGPQLDALLEVIEKAKATGLGQTAAMEICSQIERALEGPRFPAEAQASAKKAATDLGEAIQNARDYDREAERLLAEPKMQDIAHLCDCIRRVGELPTLTRVMNQRPAQTELRAELLRRLDGAVQEACSRYGTLVDLSQYELHREKLLEHKKAVLAAKASQASDKIQQTLTGLAAERGRLDAESRDARAIAAIRGIPISGSLIELRAHLDSLANLVISSKLAQETAAERRSAIEKRINQLTGLPFELRRQLGLALTVSDLMAVRDETLRADTSFLGAPEHQVMADAIRQAEVLLDLFNEYQKAATEKPLSRRHYAERVRRLQDLEARAQGVPSVPQAEALAAVREQLENRARDIEAGELRRLDTWERQVESGKLGDAANSLSWEPQFLSEADSERLQALRAAVRGRIDEDEFSVVEMHFRRISRPEKRKECIRRLEALDADLGQP